MHTDVQHHTRSVRLKATALAWALGLVLLPLSGCTGGEKAIEGQTTLSADGKQQSLTIEVVHGYAPNHITAKANTPMVLTFTRNEDPESCAREVEIPALHVKQVIPNHSSLQVTVPPQKAGTTIPFHCSMNMMQGTIVVQ
jgi:plastocyanin domain-containing protein